jgi:hypothetical protein
MADKEDFLLDANPNRHREEAYKNPASLAALIKDRKGLQAVFCSFSISALAER